MFVENGTGLQTGKVCGYLFLWRNRASKDEACYASLMNWLVWWFITIVSVTNLERETR